MPGAAARSHASSNASTCAASSPKSPAPAAGAFTPLGYAVMGAAVHLREETFPGAFLKAAA